MDPTLAELAIEATLLDRLFPGGKGHLRAGVLRWVGTLTPSDLSPTYLVSLTYDAVRHPQVRVLRPRLEPNDKGELPHIFPSGNLCLYKSGEWTWGNRLAETIIPWTCEWLLHYEIWKVTDIWHGSGGNHTGPIVESTSRRVASAQSIRRNRRR